MDWAAARGNFDGMIRAELRLEATAQRMRAELEWMEIGTARVDAWMAAAARLSDARLQEVAAMETEEPPGRLLWLMRDEEFLFAVYRGEEAELPL